MGKTLDAKMLSECYSQKIMVDVHDIEGNLVSTGLITNFTELCDIITVDGQGYDVTQYTFSAEIE